MNGRNGVPMIALDFQVRTSTETFIVRNFMSTTWLKGFLFDGGIPPGTRLSHFNDPEFIAAVDDAIDNIFDHVQHWLIDCWVKPGRVEDRGTTQPTVNRFNNAAQVGEQIQSRIMTYHIVRMVPAYPDRVDRAQMNAFKIRIANHAAVGVAPHNGQRMRNSDKFIRSSIIHN